MMIDTMRMSPRSRPPMRFQKSQAGCVVGFHPQVDFLDAFGLQCFRTAAHQFAAKPLLAVRFRDCNMIENSRDGRRDRPGSRRSTRRTPKLPLKLIPGLRRR